MGEAKRRQENDPNFGRSKRILWDARPDQSSDAFQNLPPGTSSDQYLNYLDENWDTIAAFAYAGYVEQGRGTLLLDWDLSLSEFLPLLKEGASFLGKSFDSRLYFPSIYIGVNGPFQSIREAWLADSDWQRIITTYEPEAMIVLSLCWGFQPEVAGRVMTRTMLLPDRKPPSHAYIENGDRLAEFEIQGSPLTIKSRTARAFQVALNHNEEFRQNLQTCFYQGVQMHGTGMVLFIPQNRDEGRLIYAPLGQLAEVLGTGQIPPNVQQVVDACNPSFQVPVLVIDEDILTKPTFTYFPFLVGNLDKSGDTITMKL